MTKDEFWDAYRVMPEDATARVRDRLDAVDERHLTEAFYFLGKPTLERIWEDYGVDEEGLAFLGILDEVNAACERWESIQQARTSRLQDGLSGSGPVSDATPLGMIPLGMCLDPNRTPCPNDRGGCTG